MTADLRQIVIFRHFTFLHISHPNQQICTFQGSCGQLVVIFIILKGFQESRKKLKIFMTANLREKCHFWAFHIFSYFSPKSANMHISRVLWSTGGGFHHFLKAFQKVEKFEDFHDRGPARKMSFLGISHFCIFLTQISKYANFKGPVVNWWWFSSFLKGFPENRKIWRFSCPRTCEKNVIFGHFTFLHISHPNQQICTFQGSCCQLVVIFFILNGFPDSRKIWRFSWLRTCEENVIFGHFTFLHFSHTNQQICTLQGSCGQLVAIFIIFKGFPENRKFWRFSWPRTCEKNVIFGHFTFLHISHPNQQICTFQGSCCQLVVVFIIFKGFPESRKIWRFSWPRTCDKLSFLGISHFCIFLTQISKDAHFKGPVVNWWWFSSF